MPTGMLPIDLGRAVDSFWDLELTGRGKRYCRAAGDAVNWRHPWREIRAWPSPVLGVSSSGSSSKELLNSSLQIFASRCGCRRRRTGQPWEEFYLISTKQPRSHIARTSGG